MSNKQFFAIPLIAALAGCIDGHIEVGNGFVGGPKVQGSGHIAERDFSVTDFHRIDAGGIFDVRCKVGPVASLRIEGDDNILDIVHAHVDNGTLKLETKQPYSTTNGLRATITTPHLDALNLSGAAKGDVVGIQTDRFHFQLSGAANAKGEGHVKDVELNASGAAKVHFQTKALEKFRGELSGAASVTFEGETCDAIELSISGGSHADLKSMRARNAQIGASGAASVEVNVTGSLLCDASGASHIRYAGQPHVEVRKSGASSVNPE